MNYRVKTIVLSLCAASLMTISADTILDISSGEIFSSTLRIANQLVAKTAVVVLMADNEYVTSKTIAL